MSQMFVKLKTNMIDRDDKHYLWNLLYQVEKQ